MNKFVAHAAFAAVVIAFPAAMAADRTITLSVKNPGLRGMPLDRQGKLASRFGVTTVEMSLQEDGRHHL